MMDARTYTNFRASAINKVIVDEMVWGTNKLSTAVQRKLKRVLNTQGTGKKHPGLPKRSSAPGMPPVVQTGTLWRSWTTKLRPFIGGKRALFLGSPVVYAKYLQTGTKNADGSWRMAPRPYLNHAIRWAEVDRKQIVKKVNERMRAKLRRVARQFPQREIR